MSEDAPVITVVRGTPSAEEVAALVGALLSTAAPAVAPPPRRSEWWASGLPARRRDWRGAARPA
ncbi:MAG: acyl-CoA carboxylase subunit epsilon [Hamadaea sp.]|nr:acyl-CoA carboxylase subunit epsilon [Hamadaea sp.]